MSRLRCGWGAAVARRVHGVWAPDAPEWLERLAAAAADESAEIGRFVVERVEALQYFRLLLANSLFGDLEGLAAEGAAYARARGRLEERYGRSIEEEPSAATPPPDLPFGVAPFALRFRADVLVAFAAGDEAERERILLMHTIEAERVNWTRRAGADARLHDLVGGFAGGVSAATAARLEPILAVARSHDDEHIHATVWVTRWHARCHQRRHEAKR